MILRLISIGQIVSISYLKGRLYISVWDTSFCAAAIKCMKKNGKD